MGSSASAGFVLPISRKTFVKLTSGYLPRFLGNGVRSVETEYKNIVRCIVSPQLGLFAILSSFLNRPALGSSNSDSGTGG